MHRMEDLQAFVAVVEHKSLTGAAHQLRRSLQSVSRSLIAVERETGVELVRRTTRRSNPTEPGLLFYRRLRAALDEIEAAALEASEQRSEAVGLLRVTCSASFGPLYLVPMVAAFLEAHARVEIDLDLSDRYVDLVGEGFDLAIRIGDLPDSALRARRLAALRRVVFAAPDYLARHGCPRRPDELARHQCIVRTAARDGDAWPFIVDGRPIAVKVSGRFRTSGALAANEAAAQGMGIASAPLWQVRNLVDRGAVRLLLTRFEPQPVGIHAVWPATAVQPAKSRLFMDFLVARLKALEI